MPGDTSQIGWNQGLISLFFDQEERAPYIEEAERAKVKRTSEWKRYSGEYDTVSESKQEVEVVNKAANRHSGDFQAGQASSLPPFSNSPLDNIYTPPSPLQHNACKPEVPSQVELPLVEFLPNMEESINIANYLGQEQAFSNCNDLPSSVLVPSEAENLHIPTCSALIDFLDITDPTDADFYHF